MNKFGKEKPGKWVGNGTEMRQIGNVALCCMKSDYRDCLNKAMEEWKKHKKTLPKKILGKQYRPGIYAFAYWLIRWSGLVQPADESSK